MSNTQLAAAEIILERKENFPSTGKLVSVTVLAKNSKGLYLDINKVFEGYISPKELGDKSIEDYSIGDSFEAYVTGQDKKENIFRLSIREIENQIKWEELEKLKEQNLEVEISRIVKSGVEASISATKQIGFIPFAYLDLRAESLKSKEREQWVGIKIPVRIHELDKDQRKIILNHKSISEAQREAKALEVINSLSIGQIVQAEIARITDFGAFVNINGLDALIPYSELTWRRFKNPEEVVSVGEKVEAKIFKIENDSRKVALSIKQAQNDPWTVLSEDISLGKQFTQVKVVSLAEFGAFIEVLPGVEALLHKSHFGDTEPEIGSLIDVELTNIEAGKKRMGVKLISSTESENTTEENSTGNDEAAQTEEISQDKVEDQKELENV